MKGILTFTLAAGVAITTTTIAHAAGSKPVANPTKAPVTTPASSPFSALELTLDRSSLTRELNRLNELLNLQDMGEETSTGDVPPTMKSAGAWTF
jgi:hypothetical protein